MVILLNVLSICFCVYLLEFTGLILNFTIQCYNALSQKKCTHATPTLFNAGTPNGQLASCFLMGVNEDSISGIYDSLKDCALISKHAGVLAFTFMIFGHVEPDIGGGSQIQ